MDLYRLTEKVDWLIKAATSNFAEAQHLLGMHYLSDEEFFLFPSRRKRAVYENLKAAAAQGYRPALLDLVNTMARNKDYEDFGYWLERAAEAGGSISIQAYALRLAHLKDEFIYPLDLVKAYGMAWLVAENAQKFYNVHYHPQLMEIASKMTPQQKKAGLDYANEWKKTNTVMSEFWIQNGYELLNKM